MNRTRRSKTVNAVFTVLALMIISASLIYALSFKERSGVDTSADNLLPSQQKGLSALSEEMEKNKAETGNSETPDVSYDEEDTVSSLGGENTEQTVNVSVEGFDVAKAVWPVHSKDIVMDYSYNTQPVYSRTFGEYRSDHAGIDIASDSGEDVKCAYDGKVIEIRGDAKLGMTVVVEHGSGIRTQYSNLEEKVNVTLNQNIKSGEIIGKTGNTALYESEEGSHLHFAVIAGNEYIDPCDYIKFD